MPQFFTFNFRLKLLAMCIALVMWAAVAYGGNPPGLKVVTIPVPQSQANIPAQWVLVAPIPPVHLQITGTSADLAAFESADIALAVAYSAIIQSGVQSLPIHLVNSDSNVRLYDPPTHVQADIDKLSSVTRSVTVVADPPPPSGFETQTEVTVPSTVTLTGPAAELSETQAQIRVDLSNQRANVVEDAPVLPMLHGQVATDIAVNPPTVQVTITLVSSATTREVAVVPTLSGTLLPGLEATQVDVSPSVVTVTGPEVILNALGSVPTGSIALSSLTAGPHDVTVPVSLPAGVTVFSGESNLVTVGITVKAVVVATTSPTPRSGGVPSPSSSPT